MPLIPGVSFCINGHDDRSGTFESSAMRCDAILETWENDGVGIPDRDGIVKGADQTQRLNRCKV